jgi:hypothetical protein
MPPSRGLRPSVWADEATAGVPCPLALVAIGVTELEYEPEERRREADTPPSREKPVAIPVPGRSDAPGGQALSCHGHARARQGKKGERSGRLKATKDRFQMPLDRSGRELRVSAWESRRRNRMDGLPGICAASFFKQILLIF